MRLRFFTSSREKSNALFCRINDGGSSLVVVKRVSIGAIKERAQTGHEFQRSNDSGHGVSGASARKQPCLYRQLTSCRTLDRVEKRERKRERMGMVRPLVRGALTIVMGGWLRFTKFREKSPRRQWRLGAPPLWVER